MTKKTESRQEQRTQETQARLFAAAERILVRDGYEGAQLSQIAAEAGRTKGAVYAHFKSKEDLFLALFEARTREYLERFFQRMEGCQSPGERFAALRGFTIELVEDKTWPILTMEYKLYALRHPESRERLSRLFRMICPGTDDPHVQLVFGSLTETRSEQLELGMLALGPILSALILESHFEPDQMTEAAIQQLLGRIFDAVFPAPSE